MNEITLKNYRCFHSEQTAQLAPLTLLVGENSTGKTSFMAMIRVLSDIARGSRNPDFKDDPYDLGSFDEIAHRREDRGYQADTFEAGFSTKSNLKRGTSSNFKVTFGKSGTTPVPIERRISSGKTWANETFHVGQPRVLQVGTSRGSWKLTIPHENNIPIISDDNFVFPRSYFLLQDSLRSDLPFGITFVSLAGNSSFNKKDFESLRDLAFRYMRLSKERPFAGAPVRSKPRRTYDPSRPNPDPEGDYVPMYLADVVSRDKQTWTNLKSKLEDFGKASGLFDEIFIKRLGKRGSEPFQVQARKFGGRTKGPRHNLIDMGYGLSQALPVITELLRKDTGFLSLLQQPEVHLHPKAQAALGSLFCQIASAKCQLVIETHSDHLIDRVRMDVRDGNSPLKPDDVSILWFERQDLDVKIHSLRIDQEGNILDAPQTYRDFFMEETDRSLGI